jgi:hypothetical protein
VEANGRADMEGMRNVIQAERISTTRFVSSHFAKPVVVHAKASVSFITFLILLTLPLSILYLMSLKKLQAPQNHKLFLLLQGVKHVVQSDCDYR